MAITLALPLRIVAFYCKEGAQLPPNYEVEGKITAIVDSVAGRKVHIAYGLIALKIDPEQIIREVR